MKTRNALLTALSIGLGLIACDKVVDSQSEPAMAETATLAARLVASGDAEKALLKRTQNVRVTLDTGVPLARCLQKTVAYVDGKASFPALRVGMSYALSYEGIVDTTVIWKGTASGTLAKSGNTANLSVASTDLQLKAPTIQLNTTHFSLISKTVTSLGAKLYWTRNTATDWTAYNDSPFPAKVNLADTIWAKDSIEGVIGSEVTTLVVTASGTVETDTITTLSGLSFSTGTLDPTAFDASTLNYTLTLDAGVNTVDVTPTTGEGTQTIAVNSESVASGTPKTLNVNAVDTVEVTVTNPHVSNANTYTIFVNHLKAINPSTKLSSLSANKGSWSTPFDSNTTTYTLTVDDTVTKVVFTAKAKSTAANITAKDGGAQSLTIGLGGALSVDPTKGNLSIYVTNSQTPSVTQGYTIKFTRQSTVVTPTAPKAPTVTPVLTQGDSTYGESWIGINGVKNLKFDGTKYFLDGITATCGSGAKARYAIHGASTWTEGTSIPALNTSAKMIFQCVDQTDTNFKSTTVTRYFILFLPPKITSSKSTFADTLQPLVESLPASLDAQYCVADSTTCKTDSTNTASNNWNYFRGSQLDYISSGIVPLTGTTTIFARSILQSTGTGTPWVISPLSRQTFTKSAPTSLNTLASTGSLTFETAATDSSKVRELYGAKSFNENYSTNVTAPTKTTLTAVGSALKLEATWGQVIGWGAMAGILVPLDMDWHLYDFTTVTSVTFWYKTGDAKTSFEFSLNSPKYMGDETNNGVKMVAPYTGSTTFKKVTVNLPEGIAFADWMMSKDDFPGQTDLTWAEISPAIRGLEFQPKPVYNATGSAITGVATATLEIKDISLQLKDGTTIPLANPQP